MTDESNEMRLPHVGDVDIATILLDDILDPTHRERYEYFSRSNPVLIREVTRRAYIQAYESVDDHPLSTIEIQKLIIDNVTFALSALEVATSRHRQDRANDTTE